MSAEEWREFAAQHAHEPELPQDPASLYRAAVDTFERETQRDIPDQLNELLSELRYKMEAAEYHLRRLDTLSQSPDDDRWFEGEAVFNQARSTLEILARVLKAVLPVRGLGETFDGDAAKIINPLRNQGRGSPTYQTGLDVAAYIESELDLIRMLSAVRSTTFHRYSFRSLALATDGEEHLGGLRLHEFCVSYWLQVWDFTRTYLAWCVQLAVELGTLPRGSHDVD